MTKQPNSICSQCGVSFFKPEHEKRKTKGDNHYCSFMCYTNWQKQNHKRVTLECDYCGETFEKTRKAYSEYNKHYCCQECAWDAQFTDVEKVECPICKTMFDPNVYRESPTTGRRIKGGYTRTYCGMKCAAKGRMTTTCK